MRHRRGDKRAAAEAPADGQGRAAHLSLPGRAVPGRRRHSESGQTLIMAALGLFIMALGIIATANLGSAIHERIRLQNSTDNTAYSVAAAQARTFNLIAFVNRAHVSHYVSIITLQSYLSYLTYLDEVMGMVRDALVTSAKLCCCICTPFGGCCCLLNFLRPIAAVIEGVRRVLRQALDSVIDRTVGRIVIPAIWALTRYAMYFTQGLHATVMWKNLLDAKLAKQVARDNDPDITLNMLTSLENQRQFRNVFSPAGGRPPNFLATGMPNVNNTSSGDVDRAKRMMTEIVNGTRYTSWLTNRRGITGLGALLNFALFNVHSGQTKMVSPSGSQSQYVQDVRRSSFDRSKLAQGSAVVASDDLIVAGHFIGIPIVYPDWGRQYVSVTAAPNNRGEHCFYNGRIATPCADVPRFRCQRDGNHPWEGIAPYVHFDPVDDSSAAVNYHQPSNWVIANKAPDKMSRAYTWDFTFTHGQRASSIDMKVGARKYTAFAGLNAVSRAMAYYHRPGNWHEHPNLFNPFWKAKLHPIEQQAVQNSLGLQVLIPLLQLRLLHH